MPPKTPLETTIDDVSKTIATNKYYSFLSNYYNYIVSLAWNNFIIPIYKMLMTTYLWNYMTVTVIGFYLKFHFAKELGNYEAVLRMKRKRRI